MDGALSSSFQCQAPIIDSALCQASVNHRHEPQYPNIFRRNPIGFTSEKARNAANVAGQGEELMIALIMPHKTIV